LVDKIGGGVGAGQACAIEEDGAADTRGLAEEGPAVDLQLGNETTGHDGRENADIEIAEVVGHHEAAPGGAGLRR
jgi:hypothetical protein